MTQAKFELIFTADTKQAKSATSDLRGDISALGNEASTSSTSIDKQTAALNREAEAARKAAEAANKLAEAESRASAARANVGGVRAETREETEARLGIKPRQPPSVRPSNPAAMPAGSLGGLQSSSDNSIKARTNDLAAYTQELNRARDRYKPLMEAQQRHLALLLEISTARKLGVISEEHRIAMVAKAEAAHSAQIAVIQNGGKAAQKSTALAAHEVTNLTYQLNDIVVMLASGQSPFLMMMQQGGQVAQIMGNRGLGTILPAVGQGLMSLISPTTLVLAGVTAVGYAASWAYGKMFTEVRKVDDITTEHEASIRKLREAYKYAGTGADDYYRRAAAGSRLAAAGTRKELESAVKTNARSTLNELGWSDTKVGGAGNYWAVDPAYTEFSDAITHLRDTMKDGKPDILGFRQMVEDRWNLEPNNDALLKKGLAIQKMAKDGAAAAEIIDQTSAKTIRATNILAAEQRRADGLRDAMDQLRGIAAPELSDRAQVRQGYAAGMANATDKDARTDITLQQEEALKRLAAQEQRQIELAQIDIQLQHARDPLTRAELAAKRERIQLSAMETVGSEAETRVRQARDLVMAEAMATSSSQIVDMQAEVEARTKVNDAIAAGTINAADAVQYLQLESELRPLIAAAARAEGEEKQRLLTLIGKMTAGYQALAEQDKRASALDFIHSQGEKIASLKVELAIVGETESVRNRVMAQLEAEQEIRRRGLAIGSSEATQIRANATAQEKLTQQLEKQADAWRTVRQAGENAIDGLVDKISSGDFSGALEDFAKDISKSLLTLSVTNPLKNNLLGTNLGTMSEVGGLRGIVSKLFGGGEVGASGIIQSALGGQSVGTMSVTAASVTINGGAGFGDNIIKMLSGANDNSLLGGDVNKNMANFATAIKNIESSGNYSALGPVLASGDRAYGAYQVMGANIPSWTKSALGTSLNPQQFLASNEAQDAVFSKIFGGYANKFGATGAAQAWFGGPGSVGKGNVSDILGTTGSGYAEKFNAQLQLLSGTTSTANTTISDFGLGLNNASGSLDQFGSGLGKLAQSLMSSLFPGAGGFQSNQLVNAIASGIGGLYYNGGYTGPGAFDEPKGIVHADEIVWSKRDIARAGGVQVVEGMRLGYGGYSAGGIVAQSGPSPLAGYYRSGANSNGIIDTRPVIQVINNSSTPVAGEVEETTDERGQRQHRLVMSDVLGDGISGPGKGRRTFEQVYGMRPAARRRS